MCFPAGCASPVPGRVRRRGQSARSESERRTSSTSPRPHEKDPRAMIPSCTAGANAVMISRSSGASLPLISEHLPDFPFVVVSRRKPCRDAGLRRAREARRRRRREIPLDLPAFTRPGPLFRAPPLRRAASAHPDRVAAVPVAPRTDCRRTSAALSPFRCGVPHPGDPGFRRADLPIRSVARHCGGHVRVTLYTARATTLTRLTPARPYDWFRPHRTSRKPS